MGTRSLEATLRARLLLLIGPLLVAVGVAALALTWWVLRDMDRGAAREHAQAALRDFSAERAEGDTESAAAQEVVAAADAAGVRLLLRGAVAHDVRSRLGPLPAQLRELKAGECRSGTDERGGRWEGCVVRGENLDVLAAVSTQAHATALVLLALGIAAIVALALAGAVGAARLAVARPLAGLKQLALWSDQVARAEKAAAPPESETEELARLAGAFDTLVQRLFAALERERTNSAHIAHELRTPLTAIRAELEALPSASGDAVSRMRDDVGRLERVIESILVLSAPSDAAVPDTVVNVADVVRAAAPPDTAVDAPDEALVRGDEHLIALALRNLFENAERHAGRVATLVRVSLAGKAVRIAVSDAGPGLPDSVRGRIFDAYWRGTLVGGRTSPGTGLGLSLVRAVAERHGGAADAQPNPSGTGLEVSLTLGPALGWHVEAAASREAEAGR